MNTKAILEEYEEAYACYLNEKQKKRLHWIQYAKYNSKHLPQSPLFR